MTAPARLRQGFVVYRWDAGTPFPTAGARLALGEVLAGHGVGEEVREDAQLVLSELVANAAEHACGPYEVRLLRASAVWVCEVEDGDSCLPDLSRVSASVSSEPAEEARGGGLEALLGVLGERGRGLYLVHHLTHGAWGFHRVQAGKVVWFAIPGEDR